jgi:ParB-like chromosome segregation protein Spo0J
MAVETSDAKVCNFELHHLSGLFPPMSDAEFAALKADIEAHGQRVPIVIHEGAILDGAHRHRVCMEIGVEPMTAEFDGDDPVAFVLSANLHRRHLTPGQQAAIVASAQDWGRAQTVGGDGSNQHKSKAATFPDSSGPRDTVASRAAQSGASERTQRMADTVAKASPELAKQVVLGTVSLPQALRQITPADPEQAAPAARDPVLPSPFPPNSSSANADAPVSPDLDQGAYEPDDQSEMHAGDGDTAAKPNPEPGTPEVNVARTDYDALIKANDKVALRDVLVKQGREIVRLNDDVLTLGNTLEDFVRSVREAVEHSCKASTMRSKLDSLLKRAPAKEIQKT